MIPRKLIVWEQFVCAVQQMLVNNEQENRSQNTSRSQNMIRRWIELIKSVYLQLNIYHIIYMERERDKERGYLYKSHSCASINKPEHWQQCIIYQIAMSNANESVGNDCPWVPECNTTKSTMFCLSHAMSMSQAWSRLILKTWWPCISKASGWEKKSKAW